jgi:hypothetical protein
MGFSCLGLFSVGILSAFAFSRGIFVVAVVCYGKRREHKSTKINAIASIKYSDLTETVGPDCLESSRDSAMPKRWVNPTNF